MKALTWQGREDVQVREVPDPVLKPGAGDVAKDSVDA